MKMPSQFFKKSIFISLFPITLAYSTHSFSGFDVSCYPSTNIQTNAYTACDRDLALIQVNPNWSIQARQYASYLNATIAFYNSNFSIATKIYSVLTTVDQPWIKETSQYMLIRSSLNESYQSGVGKYGDLKIDKVDQTLLKNTYEHITTYFKRFPEGKYAASARGLLRRCYWLSEKPNS